jgi:hypothetical protein
VIFAIAVAVLVLIWQSPAREEKSNRTMRILAITWAVLYCVVPKVFIATWFVFERFPPWVMLFAVAATPILRREATQKFSDVAIALALAAGLNTVWHLARIPDEADASAILDDIPPNRRVLAVTWSNHGDPIILREMWVHLLAYYQARKPGLIGYSFAKFESMPVHYRMDVAPPKVPGGLEWDARKYDPNTAYGRFFDLVLVRTPDDAPREEPADRTFGDFAEDATLISHRGRFWLYRLKPSNHPEEPSPP